MRDRRSELLQRKLEAAIPSRIAVEPDADYEDEDDYSVDDEDSSTMDYEDEVATDVEQEDHTPKISAKRSRDDGGGEEDNDAELRCSKRRKVAST